MSGPLFIGIDGGATRCRARISDAAGAVLGEATYKASANIASETPESVMQSVLRAVRAAARKLGVPEEEWRLGYAGLGLAGAEVRSQVRGLLGLFRKQAYFARAETCTDAYATWLGAFGGADGAILILGTGSCGLAVVGRRQHYVSGYGPQISDEASGHWLGRNAFRRALWASDGRIARTPLADAILAQFQERPEEIIEFAKGASPATFGAWAPSVFDHAKRGDALALSLVREAAADAEVMIRRLLEVGASSVYLHGGISGKLSAWLQPAIRERVRKGMNVKGVALEGATLLARRLGSADGKGKR